MQQRAPYPQSFWTRRSGWLSIFVAAVVAILGYLLDRFLVREGLPRTGMLLLTNSITGIVAGIFFFYLSRHARAERELMRERVRTIAELNHHIRNALQVIKFYGCAAGGSPEATPMQLIKESADRIEWALVELLPQYPGSDFELPPPLTGYAVAGSSGAPSDAFTDEVADTRISVKAAEASWPDPRNSKTTHGA